MPTDSGIVTSDSGHPVKLGSQFDIATHSPILMAYPDADVYMCSESGIKRVHYEDTEHFQVMRDFVVNPKRMLDILLDRSTPP